MQLRAQSSPRAVFAMYWTASCLAGSYCISTALRAGAGELASDWWTITDEAVPSIGNNGEATDATLTFALEGVELQQAAMMQLRGVRVLLHLLSSKVCPPVRALPPSTYPLRILLYRRVGATDRTTDMPQQLSNPTLTDASTGTRNTPTRRSITGSMCGPANLPPWTVAYNAYAATPRPRHPPGCLVVVSSSRKDAPVACVGR